MRKELLIAMLFFLFTSSILGQVSLPDPFNDYIVGKQEYPYEINMFNRSKNLEIWKDDIVKNKIKWIRVTELSSDSNLMKSRIFAFHEWFFDAKGLVTKIIDSTDYGIINTSYKYNKNNDLTSVSYKNVEILSDTFNYKYSDENKIIEVSKIGHSWLNVNQSTTKYKYDANGNLIYKSTYYNYEVNELTNDNGKWIKRSASDIDRDKELQKNIPKDSSATSLQYDSLNRLIVTEVIGKEKITYLYDFTGNLSEILTEQIDSFVSPRIKKGTFIYDSNKRMIKSITSSESENSTIDQITYSENGRKTSYVKDYNVYSAWHKQVSHYLVNIYYNNKGLVEKKITKDIDTTDKQSISKYFTLTNYEYQYY